MVGVAERNLVPVIRTCLEEHEVIVQGSSYYLVEVGVNSSLVRDLAATFGKELTDFHHELAKKVGDKTCPQTYGALVDPGLNYVFAFNRLFADYNRKKEEVVFKDPADILLPWVDEHKQVVPRIPLYSPGSNDTVFRYASLGTPGHPRRGGPTSFTKQSLMPHVVKEWANKRVKMNVGEGVKPYHLIGVDYDTLTMDDLERTYPDFDGSKFHKDLAQRVFGTRKVTNSYGLLLDDNPRIVFAFNKRFAKVDSTKNELTFMTPEQVLLDHVSPRSTR